MRKRIVALNAQTTMTDGDSGVTSAVLVLTEERLKIITRAVATAIAARILDASVCDVCFHSPVSLEGWYTQPKDDDDDSVSIVRRPPSAKWKARIELEHMVVGFYRNWSEGAPYGNGVEVYWTCRPRHSDATHETVPVTVGLLKTLLAKPHPGLPKKEVAQKEVAQKEIAHADD